MVAGRGTEIDLGELELELTSDFELMKRLELEIGLELEEEGKLEEFSPIP